MQILVEWQIPVEKLQDVMEMLAGMELEEYQAQWGPDIKVLGSWHNPAEGRGLAVVETSDAAALSQVTMRWNEHLVEVVTTIVHDDAEAHALARQHVAAQS